MDDDIKSIELIPPLLPINKLAAIVTQSKGEHWERDFIPRHAESPFPFKINPIPNNSHRLIGKKAGRITIIGYYGTLSMKANGRRRNHKSGSIWVAKCDCGIYLLKTTNSFNKSFKNPKSNIMCSCCARLESMKLLESKKHKKLVKFMKNKNKFEYYRNLEKLLSLFFVITNDIIFIPFIYHFIPKLPWKKRND